MAMLHIEDLQGSADEEEWTWDWVKGHLSTTLNALLAVLVHVCVGTAVHPLLLPKSVLAMTPVCRVISF